MQIINKKVLHVFPSPYSGGSELCALETIQILNKLGVENYAIFSKEGELIAKVKPMVKDFAIIPYDWWLSNQAWTLFLKILMIKGYLISAWKIARYIKKNNIDIVLTHTMAIPASALACSFTRVPHLWYIHEYGDLDHQFVFNYGKKRMLSFINNYSDTLLFTSKTLMHYFKDFFNPEKSVLLYNAIQYPLKKPELKKHAGRLNICMVGRITEGKNQMLALEALVLLKQENIYPVLTFVGGTDEIYFKRILFFVEENNLTQQVHYAGYTDTPWEYLYLADCALVCSNNEAFGRVTVEAMKSGIVTIVSNGGAGCEIIQDGITGFLFDANNAISLAAVLKHLWLADDTITIAENAYDYAVSNFNEEVHKKILIEVLKKTI